MTEIQFESVVDSILEELGIDYATYDFREGSDWVERELEFKVCTEDVYIRLSTFNFGDYDVYPDESSRGDIKTAIIKMDNEVKSTLKKYQEEINRILNH